MTLAATPGNDEFQKIVNADARNNARQDQSNWLRSENVIDPWYDQIILLLNGVDAQLSHHKAERARKRVELRDDVVAQEDYMVEAERWRAGALWFKKALLDRLVEAKSLRRSYADGRLEHIRLGFPEHTTVQHLEA